MEFFIKCLTPSSCYCLSVRSKYSHSSSPARGRDFSLCRYVQTGSGTYWNG